MNGENYRVNITWTPELRERLRELVQVEFMDAESICAILTKEFKGRPFTPQIINSAVSNHGLKWPKIRHFKRNFRCMTLTDPRVVYGARCTWWDTIDKVGLIHTRPDVETAGMIPCCPHCGNVLFEKANMEDFMAGAERYQDDHHPGYMALLDWMRGKCFSGMTAAKAAYTAETGITISW